MTNLDELAEPFTTAVAGTMRELAGVETTLRSAGAPSGPCSFADLSAALRLEGGRASFLVLSFPQATANELARRVLAGVADLPNAEMVRDCAGELANVVAGQAKTMLVGTPLHFTLSTPVVTVGPPTVPNAERWVAEFESTAGRFTLYLFLSPCPDTVVRRQ